MGEYMPTEKKNSQVSPGLQAGVTGLLILFGIQAVNFLFIRGPLLIIYPLQLILYFVVGRIAGNKARQADPNQGLQLNMESDVNFFAVGSVAGFVMSLLAWVSYGIFSFALGLTQVAGFVVSVLSLIICALIDLPIAIALSAYGGKTAEPH